MKFRTDFVTNSSSSSFLAFNVKHSKLYELLSSFGITFLNTEEGYFKDNMGVKLPSGEQLNLYMLENDWMLPVDGATSISSWLITLFFGDISTFVSILTGEFEEEDEDCFLNDGLLDSDFAKAFLNLLIDKGLCTFDLDDLEYKDGFDLVMALQPLDKFDKDIESADIETNTGFEGEINHLEKNLVSNGCSLFVSLDNAYTFEPEKLSGMHIFIARQLGAQYDDIIKCINLQGAVLDAEPTIDTDYIICDNKDSENEDIQKALDVAGDYCIPVISSRGFLRRFYEPSKFEFDEELMDELFQCTYDGDFLKVFYEYGVGTVERRKNVSKT